MSDKVLIKALRPFEGVEGYKDETSDPFEATPARLAELKANGLAEAADGEVDGGVKAAQDPANKEAQAPANKAAAKPQVK